MKRRPWISIVLVLLACAACEACEKDVTPKGSGALAAQDQQLFEYLPAGATAVFGGNYMKLQQFMTTTLGKTMASTMDKYGPGMKEWMKCFTDLQGLRLAGSANVAGKGLELRMIFTGMKVADVAKCATAASYATTIDPDGKFIAVELPAPAGKQGYLVAPNGALYMRQSMVISAAPTVTAASRADLEADLQAAKASNVMGDAKLQGLIAKTDRTKTMWFAGTGAGTPIANKLGELFGSFDLSNGFSADVSFQLLDGEDVDKLDSGVKEMKKMAAQLPGSMKDAVQSLQFDRKGDRVRFAVKLDDKQLGDLMKQASMFGGMH
ncbi:MAG: hypothetical protein ABI467_29930 [Kofleriaceae bacterium]